MGMATMVERLMLIAGAELATQAYDIMEHRIRRLRQMKKNHYGERIVEIEEDITESIDRLASIRHVLEIRGTIK